MTTEAMSNAKMVKMTDGTEVRFAGKRQMIKTSKVNEDGGITLRLDFVNGETRSFDLNSALMNQFAAHGAESKYGDETAGVKDVDDMILAVDELHERLSKGEWGVKREASALTGASILAKALVEHTGKPVEVIKAFLAAKTPAQKLALRGAPGISAIISRIEAEKNKGSKKVKVDTAALLGELETPAEAEASAHHGKHKH